MNEINVRAALSKRRTPIALAVGGVVTALAFTVGPTLVPDPPISPMASTGGSAGKSTASYPLPDTRPGDIFRRTELYFGSARADGKPPVTPAQFDKFVDKYVTPRFPDGLTQLTGEGQWNGSTGPVEEQSFVVILLYPLDDRGANKEIEAIRKDYKKAFGQESVLRADSLDRVSF
ncbi:DUF3574 domain-containing protein [Tenggerimyces flavus]|uniref:DUF3574 domain-containing protein n=1 Tax=Tenggerimyces flavus TaxID=1708749 RepID=A0ABV7YA35_9ACTN|nr:DUF3574 domain-containing protein [Tenggerimyces flavus]MBM7785356.1 hypothetical protein [Tenggerimyces flavus]